MRDVNTTEDQAAPPIIIVRRKSGDGDEGHHGGVWKIAYADFMTAMMAFFLVMWLVNATNEETKASVASYFNPIKLTDTSPTSKGIDVESDAGSGFQRPPPSDTKSDAAKTGTTPNENSKGDGTRTDSEASMADPYGILEKLGLVAKETAARVESAATVQKNGSAAAPGQAFIDPFNPLESVARQKLREQAEIEAGRAPAGGSSGDANAAGDQAASLAGAQGSATAAIRDPQEAGSGATTDGQVSGDSDEAEGAGKTAAEAGRSASELAALEQKAIDLSEAIRTAAGASRTEPGPAIGIGIVDGELVIQLTDTADFAMFRVGASVPEPSTRALLRAIATAIQGRSEAVIVKGHTDATPFRSGTSDNWQLSLDRAKAAYLLMREFGIESERLLRIEAHAARQPRLPENPVAAVNRRIEIVLRDERSP